MLFMTENDVKQYFHQVIRHVSKRLEIENWEFLSSYELMEKIQQHENNNIHEKLQALFKAYTDWHSFHVEIDKTGKQGNLSMDESERLMSLILKRDTSREELTSALPDNS